MYSLCIDKDPLREEREKGKREMDGRNQEEMMRMEEYDDEMHDDDDEKSMNGDEGGGEGEGEGEGDGSDGRVGEYEYGQVSTPPFNRYYE